LPSETPDIEKYPSLEVVEDQLYCPSIETVTLFARSPR